MGQAKQSSKQSNEQIASSRGVKNYLGGDSSGKAFISLPSLRAISSGIIRSTERLASSAAFRRFTVKIVVFGLAFICAFITASIAAPARNSDAAQQISATLDPTGYYVNVSTEDEVALNLITTPDGAVVVGKDTVTTETNSTTGFKLYISSNSTAATSNYLVSENDVSYSLAPTSGTISSADKLDNNSWGYTLASEYGNDSTITASSRFIGVPLLNSENLLQTVTEAVPTGSGATLNVYYGVKANTAMPAGTYTASVVYTVLAEGSPASDGEVSVSPSTSALAGGSTLTIATGLYTSANDLGAVTVAVGGTSCSNLTQTTSASGSINLTCTLPAFAAAGWKTVNVYFPKFEKTYTLTEGVYYAPATLAELTSLPVASRYMQYMTGDICDEMTEATSSNYTSAQLQLTDLRDSNTYVVRKLADGNCWMVENLRLTLSDGYAVNVDNGSLTELTSSNSNLTTLVSWTGGGTTEDSSNNTKWYSNINNPDNLPKSYTFGTEKSEYDDTDQYKGVLYNWLVVTAGQGTYAVATDGQSVDDSICPYGWRLPAYGSASTDKSWVKLLSYAGSSSDDSAWSEAVRSAPYSLIRAGAYNSKGGNLAALTQSYFWTTTAASDENAYNLGLYPASVKTDYNYAKGDGRFVRCVNR